jgi:hypothetical protein
LEVVAAVVNHTSAVVVVEPAAWLKLQHIRLVREAQCQLQLAQADLEELVMEQ